MRKHHATGVFVALALLGLDLATKAWISKSMSLGQSKAVIEGFFHLTLVHNYGAAFGMGVGWSKFVFIAVTVLATVFMVNLYRKSQAQDLWGIYGLAMILSGALGNLVDRVRLGYVVDFLDVFIRNRHWPAFNVADAAITVGAIFYGIQLLLDEKKAKAQSTDVA